MPPQPSPAASTSGSTASLPVPMASHSLRHPPASAPTVFQLLHQRSLEFCLLVTPSGPFSAYKFLFSWFSRLNFIGQMLRDKDKQQLRQALRLCLFTWGKLSCFRLFILKRNCKHLDVTI